MWNCGWMGWDICQGLFYEHLMVPIIIILMIIITWPSPRRGNRQRLHPYSCLELEETETHINLFSLAHPPASGSRARACFFYPESLNENFNLWTEELFCRTPSSSQPPERKYLHFVNLIRCQLWPVNLYRLIW